MTSGSGSYNDGESAAQVEVTVGLTGEGLQLSDPARRTVVYWRYDDIEPVDERFRGGPLRLRQKDGPARLTLSDPALIEALVNVAPRLRARRSGCLVTLVTWFGMTAAAVAILLGVIWFGLPRFGAAATSLVPVAFDVELGTVLRDQVFRILDQRNDSEPLSACTAGPGRTALDRLTARLGGRAGEAYSFEVHVLDLDIPNAFALPGGQIVLFRGLIDAAGSPDEVAGILAHEMGHVTERHGTQRLVESLGLAFFFGVLLGDLSGGAIGTAGTAFISLGFSREAEAEADRVALALLESGGMGAGGLADFFARLESKQGKLAGAFELLSSHPSHARRRQMFDAARRPGAPALDEASWRDLQSICDERRPAL